jgi:LPS export ABC transporter protein LptC
MIFQIENRFVLALFIFLAIGSSWGFYLIQQQHINKIKNYGHYPDSIAINVKSSNYDDMGILTQTVQAKKTLHYSDSQTTDFADIHIEVFNRQNNPPWLISAPSATVEDKGEVLKTYGLVNMQQAPYTDHFATWLQTHDVIIFTQKKYLTTAAPVHFVQAGLQINAIGAVYDYEKQILNLLNQVNVNYQPTTQTT